MGRGRSSKEAKKPEQADSSSSSRCASLEALAKLEKHLEDVSQYCNPSNDTKDSLASVMKLLFDSSVVLSRAQFGPFTELIVDGFDSESIWEEVQTRNRPLIRFIKKKITKILKSVKAKYVDPSKANAKLHPVNQVIDEDGYAYEYGDGDDIEDDEDEIDDHRLNRGDDDSDDDGEDNIDDDEEEGWADDDEENGVHDDEEDGDDEEDDKDGLSPPAGIDDEEEDNMEKWLDSMEDLEDKHQRKLERLEKLAGHKGAAEKDLEDEDDSDDDLMYVENALYDDSDNGDDDEDDEDDDGEVSGKSRLPKGDQIKFEDFFLPQKSAKKRGGKGDKKEESKRSSVSKKASSIRDEEDDEDDEEEEDGFAFGDADNDDDEEGLEGDFDGEDDYEGSDDGGDDDETAAATGGQSTEKKELTNFQKRQQKLAKEIAELESSMIGPKKWELKGEVKAGDRPEDSLLGISAQIERASKPAPVATEEFTSSLEELIIQRIKDEKFDDVIPREKPDEIDLSVRDAPELSQEKSKMGLGDVYAEDFLKKATGGHLTAQAAKEEALRFEAKEIFHKVCRMLDGLSHFHFSPRPVVSEAKISGSGPEAALPSLALEDILPLTESGATAVAAPEEVQDKKRGRDAALVAEAELSREDRRRLHRATKAAKRKENKAKEYTEKLTAQQNTAEGYAAEKRLESKKTDEVLRKDRRVIDATGAAAGKGKKRKGRGDDDGDDDKQDLSAYTKSAAFFSKLQRVAQEEISGAKSKASKKDKQMGPEANAAKFKL